MLSIVYGSQAFATQEVFLGRVHQLDKGMYDFAVESSFNCLACMYVEDRIERRTKLESDWTGGCYGKDRAGENSALDVGWRWYGACHRKTVP